MATPAVFLPENPGHKRESLAGCSPWGSQWIEHNWAEWTRTHTHTIWSEQSTQGFLQRRLKLPEGKDKVLFIFISLTYIIVLIKITGK